MFLQTPDVVTRADFPMLLENMGEAIGNDGYSGEFRQACQSVIDAINQADDEDAATHEALRTALQEYVRIGNLEIALHYCEGASC
jgi:hypothetical protein